MTACVNRAAFHASGRGLVLGMLAAGVVCGASYNAAAQVQVRITAISANCVGQRALVCTPSPPQRRCDNMMDFRELKIGDTVNTGQIIRAAFPCTITWERVGAAPGCGNTGTIVAQNPVTDVEVGKDIRSLFPPAGYFHLVSDPDLVNGGVIEITETGECHEEDHCGISTDLAIAAALDPTPPGMETHFVGSWGVLPSGDVGAVFGNAPWSAQLIVSVPVVGPHAGDWIEVPPGATITWYMDGSFEMGEWQEPCVADWNGDGEVDVNDFFAFLDSFVDGDPRADLNGDGEIDVGDFFLFLGLFQVGC